MAFALDCYIARPEKAGGWPRGGMTDFSLKRKFRRNPFTILRAPAGGTLALGHETTPIGEIHPAEPAGWGRVGVPGRVPLDLTLDSNDLTRLNGFVDQNAHLGAREQKLFCFFECSDGHLTRDGRKPLQKVFECFSALQIVEQRLDRHARTAKHRSSTKNIRIFDNDSHALMVSRGWPRGGMTLDAASLSALLSAKGAGFDFSRRRRFRRNPFTILHLQVYY